MTDPTSSESFVKPLPSESLGVVSGDFTDQQLRRGRTQRRLANFVTRGRTAVGLALTGVVLGATDLDAAPDFLQTAGETLLDYKSLSLGAVTYAAAATDKLDGMLARASERNGVPITDEHKKLDPFHDKIFNHSLMAGYWVRELVESVAHHDKARGFGALAVAASQAAFIARDYKMTKSRENAPEGADVSAVPINKAKSAGQFLVQSAALTPVPSPVVAGAFAGLAGVSWVGYRIADKVHRGQEYSGFWPSIRDSFKPVEG